ncbi:MAG: helix-turn-helix domain-containing protein [Chitinophagaceae bacterium]
MKEIIPTYSISNLSKQKGNDPDFFLLTEKVDTSKAAFNLPFRSHYYGVGICLQGKAELKANLESYTVIPNSIVAMSPQIIKQWIYMSDDFKTSTIFFTKEFITTNNFLNLNNFSYFESVAQHCFSTNDHQASIILASLNFIKEKYEAVRFFREEILKSLTNVLLYDINSIYVQEHFISNSILTRAKSLSSDFKKLVNIHFSKERSVKFYADVLNITPKHLTETVKHVTGKTAGEWIDDTVILEAKVLLQNPNLTISQIADILHFSDQSIFGKFFKNLNGLSPIAYRQSLS